MNLIKLNATTSTNSHLKALYQSGQVEPPCCVTAQWQTAGRGQMGTRWEAQKDKNIIMSALYAFDDSQPEHLFAWNAAVAIAVAQTLDHFRIPHVSIKWPNDILAGPYKLAGILIENVFEARGRWVSIVGIGLNVNQLDFEGLPLAGSMHRAAGHPFVLGAVLEVLLNQLQIAHQRLPNQTAAIWSDYHERLFQRMQNARFSREDGSVFEATPIGVDPFGRLQLQYPDGSLSSHALKEVQWLRES